MLLIHHTNALPFENFISQKEKMSIEAKKCIETDKWINCTMTFNSTKNIKVSDKQRESFS